MLAFRVFLFKVLKHTGTDSCECSCLSENCYKASNHMLKSHTGLGPSKRKVNGSGFKMKTPIIKPKSIPINILLQ